MPTTDDDLPTGPATPAEIPPVKPGRTASELWATILAMVLPIVALVLDAILRSGKVEEGTPWHVIIVGALSLLAAFGYTAGRSIVKSINQLAVSNLLTAQLHRDAEVAKLRRAQLEYRQAA